MTELKNVDIIRGVMVNLCGTIGSRTSRGFAIAIVDTITRNLEKRFDFLKHIKFSSDRDSDEVVFVDSEINSVDPVLVGRAIEAIIQVICLDLREKAGLYFINELEKNTEEHLLSDLTGVGVDLALLKVQQHYLYRQQKRVKSAQGDKDDLLVPKKKSFLEYSWDNVSECVYDADSKTCTLIGKDGRVLDKIDLDTIVSNHLKNLTESDSTSSSTDYKREDKEKCLKLEK